MTHAITDKDALFFRESCKKIIDAFGGLSEYLWDYEVVDGLFDDGRNAQCAIERQAQRRTLSISGTIENRTGNKNKDIIYLAFHEVMEGLLGDLTTTADSRYITPEQIEKETHAVINRFWNMFEAYILPKLIKKGNNGTR